MHPAALQVVLLLLVRSAGGHGNDELSQEQKVGAEDERLLLVVSLDGFTHSWISPDLTPNLYSLASGGVELSRGILSLVNTVTASNHHSIVTGLYQESHGIIDNTFYDPNLKQFYDIWNFHNDSVVANRSVDRHWYGGTPVWETYAEATGRKFGLMRWPMCNIPSKWDQKQKLCEPWEENNRLPEWKLDVDQLVKWFSSGVQFGMLYIPEPDHTQHSNDLKGPVVAKVIREVDSLIGYLKDKFVAAGLWGQLNLVVTGDHGHQAVDLRVPSNLVIFDEILTPDMIASLLPSSNSFFLSPTSKHTANEVFLLLSQAQRAQNLSFHVWLKDDFPAAYHWKDTARVGPIIYFPRKGALVRWNTTREKVMAKYASADLSFGTHGYLNDEVEAMRPLFVASGPSFRQSFTTDSTAAELIDVYLLICAVLDVSPADNNATFDHIAQLLQPRVVDAFRPKLSRPPPYHWNSGGEDVYRFVEENQSSLVVAISIILPSVCCVAYLLSCLCCGRPYQKSQVGSTRSHSTRESFVNGASTPSNGGSSRGLVASAKRHNTAPNTKPLLLLEKEGSSESQAEEPV